MNKFRIVSVLLVIILAGTACNLTTPTTTTPNPAVNQPALTLVVNAQNGADTFNTVDQIINYAFTVTNTGPDHLAGPVTVTDNKIAVSCPDLTTVGDLNNNLDPNEVIICTGDYKITQADLDAGLVTDSATASMAGGTVQSLPAGTTVNMTQIKTLELTKSANPQTYNQQNTLITYTYTIKNTGNVNLGPAQFTITDDHIGAPVAPFNCGAADTTLAPAQSITCNANYTISQTDMYANSVINNASAAGGGSQTSQNTTVTITNTSIQTNPNPTPNPNPANLTPGSTIQHVVKTGEWMIQIARCYGADYNAVRLANPQVPVPGEIKPGMVLTIPNIGSNGPIYDKECVVFYTAAAGDTWQSIATKYNARVDVLQAVNPNGLYAGAIIKVPINSAGGGSVVVNPTPTTGLSVRLTIPQGSTFTTASGTLISQNSITYVISASQGQTMTLTLNAPAGEIMMRVYDPSGNPIKTLDTNLTWVGNLTLNGDYRIDLIGVNLNTSKTYTLKVDLFTPTSALEQLSPFNGG